jgi:hypothetical protein
MGSELTAERLRELLHYDPLTGLFRRLKQCGSSWKGDIAGTVHRGYIVISIDGRNHKAHRLAWLYVHGKWPDDQIDHRDRDKANNRFANLRAATNKQNHENLNMPRNNTSGHRGVYWYKPYSKWIVFVGHNNNQVFVGYFDSIAEAVAARKKAEQRLFTHAESTLPIRPPAQA